MSNKDTVLESSTLLVDLDSLLDTRLGTLSRMGVEPYLTALKGDYHRRLNDYFEGIDNKVFKELYVNRDKQTLKHSHRTPVLDFIKEFTLGTVKNITGSPFHYKPKIMLNTYPYKDLTKADEKALITLLVRTTMELADVELCYRSLDELHPAYIKSNIAVFINYHYNHWLEHYTKDETFKKITCPEVSLLGPALVFKDELDTYENIKEAFKYMEIMSGPFIGLRLLDVEMFSSVLTYETLVKAANTKS